MKQNNIWFSLVLALLLWAFIPQRMMAEEVHVSNYQEFKEQVGRSDGKTMTIVLDDDIVVDETLEGYGRLFNVWGDTRLTIRLNGHNITAQQSPAYFYSYFFEVYSGATITLDNGHPENGKQGKILSSNTFLFLNNGASCYLNDVYVESENRVVSLTYGAVLNIEGNTTYLKSTSDEFSPLDVFDSSVNFLGECELVANDNIASLNISDYNGRPAYVNLPIEYDALDKSGHVIDYDKSIWKRSYVKVAKNASYGEACKDGEHVLEFHAATSPTCTEKGNLPYYICTKCKRLYKDDAAKELYYKGEYEIAALGHDFGRDDKCQREGCDAIQEYVSLHEGDNEGLEFVKYASYDRGEEYKVFSLYKYVAQETNEVTFSSYGNIDTRAVLLDQDKNLLARDDDSGEGNNFSISYNIEKGKVYFLGLQAYIDKVSCVGAVRIANTQKVESYSLTDAETYQSEQKMFVETLTYQRTVTVDNVGKWQPLFVPFQMSYDEWKDDFDVAAINNVHEYYDKTGEVKKREMEVRRVTHGRLYASFPYLIRAKSAGEKTLIVKNTPLVTSTIHQVKNYSFGNFIDFEETLMKGCYFVWGAYEPMLPEAVNSFLSLHDGALVRVGSEETIVPQRWYLIPMLSESNEEAKPLDISNDESFAKIAIREMGSGETTGIEDIKVISSELDDENSGAVPGIYDLNGIRQNTLKKGVNIIRQADGSVRKIVKK